MGVSVVLHAVVLPVPAGQSPYQLNGRMDGHRNWPGSLAEQNVSCLCRVSKCNLSVFQPWTRHDILLAPNKNLYELKSVFAEDMILSQHESLQNIRPTINK